MPNDQNRYLENLLDLMANRVHRRRRQSRVAGPNGYRVIGSTSDDTGVGDNNETENLIADDLHILDCGHAFLHNNLGGQCHYCDGLICIRCILTCSHCGHTLCPQHLVIANFDDQNRPYCRNCADDISRKRKVRAIRRAIFSFFVSDTNGQDR